MKGKLAHSFTHAIVPLLFPISICSSLSSQANLQKAVDFGWYQTMRTKMEAHCGGL